MAKEAEVRITWWSNGTRAKETDIKLMPGETATLELTTTEKVTVERRT